MPTFDDVNELTTSGAFPERSAAMILSSLIPPTTLMSTFGFFASYSDTTFLNSLSSRALHPTQTVSVVACACRLEADDETAATHAASTSSAIAPAATAPRLMGTSSSGRCAPVASRAREPALTLRTLTRVDDLT